MMEEGQDIYARIDQYLLNQMKPEEKSAFEQELNQNPDLRNKVKIQGLIIEEIKRRDEQDTSRTLSPLKPATDSVIVDTTSLSFDEVVNKISELIRRRKG